LNQPFYNTKFLSRSVEFTHSVRPRANLKMLNQWQSDHYFGIPLLKASGSPPVEFDLELILQICCDDAWINALLSPSANQKSSRIQISE
jgi:hypothetical protein